MREDVVLQAPAKVNLFLRVFQRRPDGYHNLLSLMQMVGLYDLLAFEEAPGGIQLQIRQSKLPSGPSNLVFQAAERLQKEALAEGKSLKGVLITLSKNIPISAGLGGGSSDAATTLIGLNRFWRLGWSRERLAALGAEIGSDLPFFFYGPCAWVSGKGDQVESLAPAMRGWLVLIHPEIEVSTASVYEALSKQRALTKEISPPKISGVGAERPSIESVFRKPLNDLESVTLNQFPRLEPIKTFLRSQGGEGALMSGSGPTLFSLFSRHSLAEAAADQIRRRFLCRVSVSKLLQRSPV